LNPSTLTKQYKEHLSNFLEWYVGLIPENLVYPENFGTRMSIDEVALSNGELYTVITSKDAKGKKGCLAAIIKGTKAAIICTALENVPINIRFAVKEITLDLANNMDWIARTTFPNAIITADRFHFQQVVTEAVQDIRIRFRKEITDQENLEISNCRKLKQKFIPFVFENGDTGKQLLARSRYLLFKPASRWTESQKQRAQILFNEYPTIKEAYKLSMHFRGIFESSYTPETAKARLNVWYDKVNIADLADMISASHTIKNHEGKILNYFHTRSTNASAESFNAKIKGFRALLRGVTDIKFFLFRLERLFS
jgi:transposase